jgi:hypothetical protein
MTITKNDIDLRIEYLRKVTGKNYRYNKNLCGFMLELRYPTNDHLVERDISPRLKKSEFYRWLCAFLAGIDAAKGQ